MSTSQRLHDWPGVDEPSEGFLRASAEFWQEQERAGMAHGRRNAT